jgi:hypothetical protein
MILRLLAAFAIVVAALITGVVLITREGDQEAAETGTALSWKQVPRLYGVEALPRDRVAVGRVLNTGTEDLTLSAGEFELRDDEGRELAARVQFIDPSKRPPSSLGLGTDLELAPGEQSPLTVSYRLDPRALEPVVVFFEGAPALRLPEGPVLPQP